uniref:Glycerol-3-phosphate acyltransferase 3 n=1 Tax=Canis lupus familiaris TaxID=9615 RepID=A0A8C0RHV3_CANLF
MGLEALGSLFPAPRVPTSLLRFILGQSRSPRDTNCSEANSQRGFCPSSSRKSWQGCRAGGGAGRGAGWQAGAGSGAARPGGARRRWSLEPARHLPAASVRAGCWVDGRATVAGIFPQDESGSQPEDSGAEASGRRRRRGLPGARLRASAPELLPDRLRGQGQLSRPDPARGPPHPHPTHPEAAPSHGGRGAGREDPFHLADAGARPHPPALGLRGVFGHLRDLHEDLGENFRGIIQRDESPMEKGLSGLRGRDFELSDVFYFSKKGLEAIVEDEVTQRFSSEELVSWNLLTRTNINFQYISLRLTMVWVLGVIVRYCVLLPLRVTLAFIGISLLVIGTTLVGQLPDGSLKNWLSELVHLTCCRICVRALSGTIHYHNKQYRPQKGGICVANHTSPIDVLILTTDGCYAMVGQVHGGLMGIIQRAMVKACPHVWFERSEMKDRHLVTKRLKEHIADKKKLPILIFPEGTCINNTSVMMFKKGSFEIGGTIHPVAIKYNPQFGDAFWNSSKYNMVSYLLRMMTSWAIVCDVWYMPPMSREEEMRILQGSIRGWRFRVGLLMW